MKRILAVTMLIGLCAAPVSAQILYDITFDDQPAGPLGDATVMTPSGNTTLAFPVSDTLTAQLFGAANGPEFASAVSVASPAFSSTNALVLQSGGLGEGVLVQMNQNIAPADLTIEAHCLSTGPVVGNTADLQTVMSTEWPGGQTMQQMLRIHGTLAGNTGMRFHTDRGDTDNEFVEEGVLHTDGVWLHVAAVLDYNESTPASSSIEMFINGVSEGTSPYNASANSFSLGSSGTEGAAFAIGYNLPQNLVAPGDNRGLDGAIDRLVISTATLGPGTFVLDTSPTVPVELSILSSE